jgi:cyclase
MQKISRNVYVGTDICNHSFVVTKEGLVMIDTPVMPPAAAAWQRKSSPFGSVRYLVNTEGHMDHFGGNYFFEGEIVAHQGTREGIENASVEGLTQMIGARGPENLPLPDLFYLRLPTITFTQELTLYLGDHTFRLINLPGHTASETIVYVPEERVVFASDNVVNKAMPFFHQALPYEWLESLDRIEELDVDTVVPGHGVIGDKGCIQEMGANVRVWIDAVRGAIDKGMTLEQAQDSISLIDRYPDVMRDPGVLSFFQRMSIARLYEVLKG